MGLFDNDGPMAWANSQDFLAQMKRKNANKSKIPTTNVFGNNQFGASPFGGVNAFASGGGIHIKPSHRGRLTELKKRTGKTEAELYNDGNPAHKKMVTFARNSRKWKHAYGGSLDEDNAPLFAYGGNLKDFNQPTGLMGGKETFFALGGDVQTHGADFTSGAMMIDAGGSHEESPNDGVQIGTDSEGTPNLVEEGECIFNDYVYSQRISCDETCKEMFHISKKREITYADMARKLAKDAEEHVNDPITKAALKVQMQDLADQQERQKQEMEAERAEEAFNALSDEEKVALMQQAQQQEEETAMQEQMAQQQAMQPSPEEMAMAQQQMSPEEAAMMQEQQQMIPEQAPMEQQQVVAAYGGPVNRYDKGGALKQKIYSYLNKHTDSEFRKWLEDNGLKGLSDRFDDIKWEDILKLDEFRAALSKDNPALAHALKNNYDFGAYSPEVDGKQKYAFDQAFWDKVIEDSKKEGKSDDTYQIAKYDGDVKALEASKPYQDFTDYILKDATDEERLNYFKWIDANTGNKNKYIKDGKLRDDWKKRYEDARTDHKYGIQHVTPDPVTATRTADTNNFVINEDGTIEPIVGDVPTDWKTAGNYSWADSNNDYAYNYYTRPMSPEQAAEAEKKAAEEAAVEKAVQYEPILKKETNYGLFGPAVGLGLMMAGVGKPDYSEMDRTLANAARNYHTATNRYLGNYMKYKPLDTWFNQAKIDAMARATDRAIMNSGANQGTVMAGLLQNGLNTQLAAGEALRAGTEANRKDEFATNEYNKATDLFNAQAHNQLSQFNTSQANQYGQALTQLGLDAAQTKLANDAGWYNSLYGNINAGFGNIKEWEKWKRDHNTIARIAADNLFGTMTDKQYTGKGYIKPVYSSEGGQVKRKKGKKRGLTV